MPSFITITIPRAYVPAFAAELVTRYGQKAETIYYTTVGADDPLHALLAMQPHREELSAIEHAFDQPACDGALIDAAYRSVRVDRAIFEAALHGTLLDAIEDLDQAHNTLPDTRDLGAMLHQHRRIGELLALLGAVQDATSRPGVIVRTAPEVATQAAGPGTRTWPERRGLRTRVGRHISRRGR